MHDAKSIALILGALLMVGGLSACQQSGVQPGMRTDEVREIEPSAMEQPVGEQYESEEFNRTYVRELPEATPAPMTPEGQPVETHNPSAAPVPSDSPSTP